MYILNPQKLFVLIFLFSVVSCRVKPGSTETEGSSVKVIGGSRVAIPVPEVPVLKIMPTPNADYYWQSFGQYKHDDGAPIQESEVVKNCSGAFVRYTDGRTIVKTDVPQKSLFLATAAHCVINDGALEADRRKIARVYLPIDPSNPNQTGKKVWIKHDQDVSGNGVQRNFFYLDIPLTHFFVNPRYFDNNAALGPETIESKKIRILKRSIYDLAIVSMSGENLETLIKFGVKGLVLDPHVTLVDLFNVAKEKGYFATNPHESMLSPVSIVGWGKIATDKTNYATLPDHIAQNYTPALDVESNTNIDLYMRSNWLVKRIYLGEEEPNKEPPKASGLLFTGYSLLAGDSGAPMVFPIDPEVKHFASPPEIVTSFDPGGHRIIGLGISCEMSVDFTSDGDHKDCKDIKSINTGEEMTVNNFVDLMSPMSLMLFQSATVFNAAESQNFGAFYPEQLTNIPAGIPRSPDFFAGETLFELKDDQDVRKIPEAQNGVGSIEAFVGDQDNCPDANRADPQDLSPEIKSSIASALFTPFSGCSGIALQWSGHTYKISPKHCAPSLSDSEIDALTPRSDFETDTPCQNQPQCVQAIPLTVMETPSTLQNLGFAFVKSDESVNISFRKVSNLKCPFLYHNPTPQVLKVGFNTRKKNSGGLVFTVTDNGAVLPLCMHIGLEDGINDCLSFTQILPH